MDRLREEQERKEDAEIEQLLATEKAQRRQPLADLSKKSTGTKRCIKFIYLSMFRFWKCFI
jgi:hypothetical protein